MGCDIHFFTEKFEDGVWKSLDDWDTRSKWRMPKEKYDGRNYDLFGILAGVRNQLDLEPLERKRGLPDDLSPEVKSYYEEVWRGDGHSYTFYCLPELLSAPWDLEVDIDAYTDEDGLKRFNETGHPSRYRYHYYADMPHHVKLKRTYEELAGKDFMDLIRGLAEEHDPKTIRFVMWFDS